MKNYTYTGDVINLRELFNLAMARIPEDGKDFEPEIDRIARTHLAEGQVGINLGAGTKQVEGFVPVGLEQHYDLNTCNLPFQNGDISSILAFHVFEHLTPEGLFHCLRECERVLQPGGTLTVCVPHYLGRMAYNDATHRILFSSDIWKHMFDTRYYDNGKHGGKDIQGLQLHLNVIMGVDENNLVMLTQFVRA